MNGVKHNRVAPYHPSSNGAVERLVQSFKPCMKVGEHDGLAFQHRLQNFLMTYRSTPQATTGQSPASLFLGRPIHTRFDLMRPVLGEKVRAEQAHQKQCHDAHTKFCQFTVGTRVMIRDGRDKSIWSPGIIRERYGPVSFLVQLESGAVQRKHMDHLQEWAPIPKVTTPDLETESLTAEFVSDGMPVGDTSSLVPHSVGLVDSTSEDLLVGSEVPVFTDTEEPHGQFTGVPESMPKSSSTPVVSSERNTSHCYPQHQRKPTERYMYT